MSVMGNVQALVTPHLVGELARRSGVAEPLVRTGVTGAAASILDGLVAKAGDARAMDQVASLINETPDEIEDVDQLVDAPPDSPMRRRGGRLLEIVGPDAPGLANRVARFVS